MALAATIVAWGAAFVLPLSAPWAAVVVILLSAGGGIANAWFERRLGVVPLQRSPGARRIPLRLALWGGIVPVAWLPVAWALAMLTSRWGPELIFKPSFQGRIEVNHVRIGDVDESVGVALGAAFQRIALHRDNGQGHILAGLGPLSSHSGERR